jgi:hypothetical protein
MAGNKSRQELEGSRSRFLRRKNATRSIRQEMFSVGGAAFWAGGGHCVEAHCDRVRVRLPEKFLARFMDYAIVAYPVRRKHGNKPGTN